MAPDHKPRCSPRIRLPWRLTVEYHHSYRAPLRDLSMTGAFIDDDLPFPVGQPIPLTIWLNENEAIEVEAVVRRASRGRGLGVEFVGMTHADSVLLHDFLAAAQSNPARKAS